MDLKSLFVLSSLTLLTIFGAYMIMVETFGYQEESNMDIETNGSPEDEIDFDEITIDDYCNTAKGRADVFCKQEL